jgi:hypothetical protein
MPKELMDESCTGNVSLTGTIYIVFVRGFIKGNVLIARMTIDTS